MQMAAPISEKLRYLAWTSIKVLSCYFAVGIAFLVIQLGLESPFVTMHLKRLAWRLSPHSTFPFPLEPGDLDSNYFLDQDAKRLLASLAVLTAVVGGIHLITFSITAILHRRRSVPNYWRDLDPPPDATRMLLQSALWGSWAFLLTAMGQLVGKFEFESVMFGSSFPFTGNMSVFAAFAVSILILMAISSRAVKRVVLERLNPNDRRCLGCEQALRVTTANRCPECGQPFDPAAKLDYRLKWGPVSFLMTRRWPVVVFVCLMILSAPFAITRLAKHLPRSVQIPMAKHVIGPLGSFRGKYKSYPIRLDSICIFQQKSEVVLVRFEYVRPEFARYRALHWRNSTLLGKAPPDQDISGEVDLSSHVKLIVFSWSFSVSSGGGRMVWLYNRDTSIKVQSYLQKDVPQEYRAVVESMIGGSR